MQILSDPKYALNVREYEIWVEEHDGYVRFKSGSRNMAVSCMRHASGYNYRNSSFIVDLAMGQIPRSTERISSFYRAACNADAV